MKSPGLLRALALAGLLISGYLLFQKVTGQIDAIVGCGGESGCANVLGSRWSQYFGVPVSALSATIYLALLVATWKPSRPVYAAFAILLAGAALWFVGLLIVEVKAFCPWCSATHVIGVTCAVILFLSVRKLERPEGPETPLHFAPLGAVTAMILLVLGQVFGPVPDTHLETGGSQEKENKETAVHARPAGTKEGRLVAVFDDSKHYNTGTLPHLGPADAPHVIVKYFDFTCASCRDMKEDLHMVVTKHPGKFCIIMLPVPLNRSCNPHYPGRLDNHEHACELARLGLAAWRAKPEAFPEVHEALFTRPVLQPEIAEIAVAQIVGEEALAKALEDPWVDELLKANLNDFRQLIAKTIKMPKLLVGKGRMLHGVTNSAEILLRSLEDEFKLTPSK
jgi:uncharacterized membrane protein